MGIPEREGRKGGREEGRKKGRKAIFEAIMTEISSKLIQTPNHRFRNLQKHQKGQLPKDKTKQNKTLSEYIIFKFWKIKDKKVILKELEGKKTS